METVKELKNAGIAKGLCRQWQMKLKSGLNIADLSRLYIKGIDFCISENFPTLDYFRDHFKGQCEPYGIYVDDEVSGLNNVPDIVLNGDCKANLDYYGYSVSRIYTRHKSIVTVNISDHAILTIDAFDDSRIIVNSSGKYSKVFVNLYGKSQVESTTGGLIKVTFKNKITY